jgi:flagellar export protein FliJ
MKRRDSLLRLKRFRVDEFKRRLATLDEMKADLERKLVDLNDSVTREKQRAEDSEIGRLAFPSFLQSIDARRKNIRATTAELDRERSVVQDELAAAFQDLKGFEIAEEERLRRLTEAEARAAQSRMDEMALVRHLRKHAIR